MGRSSILFISALLSFDYGIRVSTYTSLAMQIIRTLMCRLFSKWYVSNEPRITMMTNILIPLIFFAITLPIALRTTVNHLKHYARLLFALSCTILALVMLAMFLHTDQRKTREIETCIPLIYELDKLPMQPDSIMSLIPVLTQIPNISA